MAIKQYSYIGKGKFWIRKRGATTAPRVEMGNVTSATFNAEEEEKKLKDYTSAGGGTLDSVKRVESVTLEFTTTNMSPANLAIAQRGLVTLLDSVTAIADEVVAVVPGGMSLLARLPNPTVAMTVENTAGTVTYVDGTDYQRTTAGIEVLAGGAITAGDVHVSYTPLPENVLEALVSSGDEYELVFEGINEARSGLPHVVETHRIVFSPSSCDLIGDEFGELTFSAEVLADDTKVGTGISKFFRSRTAVLA